MSKKFPARSASRGMYIFWLVVAVVMVAWGMTQFIRPGGNLFWGFVAIVGFIGMAMRETVLRRRYKQSLKPSA
ncbi:hypothetical protein KS461_10015 [Pseudomonas chlororaphis]|uniref:hypothetical protein n=1 Tax=Pseudomonas chlororaphis TaxID=587753 RepID=UPI00215ACB18|nr:hypothetical protein [Pseudomonas chlororaphis]UVE47596.1 hypothetical protein KS461_10015 [Pseudomonas chlororaphis]